MLTLFLSFLKLGLTSFGGPVAHLGYFREEFVIRKQWLTDKAYADLVALCQFLPGPASSQIGIAIGYQRGGLIGSILAWIGFTLPSALILIGFAQGLQYVGNEYLGWIHGFKVVAVSVVAQAVWVMGRKLCPDRSTIAIMLIATLITSLFSGTLAQILAIVCGLFLGSIFLNPALSPPSNHSPQNHKYAPVYLALFILFLIFLPALAQYQRHSSIIQADAFYRAGSLVFGGGHVVLPLLEADFVDSGFVNRDQFLAGYGAAQAVPGPLFTFAAYLGAIQKNPGGIAGGLFATACIFLPSFFLILGTLPYWDTLSKKKFMLKAMPGINAAVVGILMSALYDPVITSGILSPVDFVLALIFFCLLEVWKLPSWVVVLLGGILYANHQILYSLA